MKKLDNVGGKYKQVNGVCGQARKCKWKNKEI